MKFTTDKTATSNFLPELFLNDVLSNRGMTACTTVIKDNNNYGRGKNYESCFQAKEMRHKISIMIKDYCMIKPFLAKGEKTHTL